MAPAAAIASVAMTVISTAVSVYQAVAQGSAQENMARYNASIAERNAQVAGQAARAARDQASLAEQQHRERIRKLLGGARALYAKAGVTEEGSPLLVMESSAQQAELDAQIIRYRGEIQAGQALDQASAYRMEAILQRMRGQAAGQAGRYEAGSSLLTGASNMMGQYGTYRQAGIF